MYLLATPFTGAEAVTIGVVIGVVVVLALTLTFVLGARRREREPAPDLEPRAPHRDSWATHPSTPGRAPHGDPDAPGHHT
ncbi:hypothetical protein GXW83_00735 [Streptacidiphilus sp. PB12-B1b]|uniref:DUF6479 family protein n=1 Tax=Streptacidiphilus sp. PB12-B1b TaxID=2705012 RepID=UPI0015FC7B29|nr:DUF6479 family protein [Streptacidiphilus sp. PB12-B1b]QMU74531.1 hypothetical protein GXW83_00735 [Streptacidiphilus sp. PB12-B1b]